MKDIREVTAREIRDVIGSNTEIALVAGCPPCQGFSRIRRRNASRATTDRRNDLVLEFGRIVRALRPKAFMMENVPGLETDRRYSRLVRSLRGAGYTIDWQIVDLAKYGVPQRRRRLVVIGWRDRDDRPDLSQIVTGPSRTVRDAIGYLPKMTAVTRRLHEFKVRHSDRVQRRIKRVPLNGGSRSAWHKRLRLKCHADDPGFRDVYGRMRWDSPAPTITGGCINPSKGRFLHPTRGRAISVVEAARLQTFPIWFRFNPADGRYSVAEMIGEALPPLFARRAAAYIIQRLKKQ